MSSQGHHIGCNLCCCSLCFKCKVKHRWDASNKGLGTPGHKRLMTCHTTAAETLMEEIISPHVLPLPELTIL